MTELQARLDAMVDQLRSQVSLRLSLQGEVLIVEQERLRSMLARIGELAQRASEARSGEAGEAAPDLGR